MACAGDKDVWDGCKDNTVLEFNYTACGDKIAYSGSFVLANDYTLLNFMGPGVKSNRGHRPSGLPNDAEP